MGRENFRFQGSFDRQYRVFPNGPYTAIQSAIDAAVADQSTANNDDPRFVLVYPKGSPYVENLTLAPGVHLIAVSDFEIIPGSVVQLTGQMTYSPVNAFTRDQNTVFVEDFNISAGAGLSGLIFSGTAPAQITLNHCNITKTADATAGFLFTNTGAGSRARFHESGIQSSVATALLMDLQRGETRFRGYRSFLLGNIGTTDEKVATLSNAATLFLEGTSVLSFADELFEIAGASAILRSLGASIQNTKASGHIVEFSANGNAVLRNSVVIVNTTTPGNIGNGATGTLTLGGNEYAQNSTRGFAPVATGVTCVEDDQVPRNSNTYGIFRVGSPTGYATVQEAITDAIAKGLSQCDIVLENGTYTGDVSITGTDQIFYIYSKNPGNRQATIVGQITYNPNSGGQLYLKNIVVQAGIGDAALEMTGVNDSTVIAENCLFEKTADNTVSLIIQDNINNFPFFNRCRFQYNQLGSTGAVFELSNDAELFVNGKSQDFYDIDEAGTDSDGAQIGILGDSSVLEFWGCRIRSFAENSFTVGAGARVSLTHARMEWQTEFGTLFFMNGLNAMSDVQNTVLNNDETSDALLARQGVQAVNQIQLTGNVYAPGDGFNVNGVTFVNGVDFTVAGTTAGTASNIAAAINASGAAGVNNKIYDIANGVNIDLFSVQYGTIGNAYTLALIGTAPATITGATFAGGANGAGAEFKYANSSFINEQNIQADITATAYPTAPVAL